MRDCDTASMLRRRSLIALFLVVAACASPVPPSPTSSPTSSPSPPAPPPASASPRADATAVPTATVTTPVPAGSASPSVSPAPTVPATPVARIDPTGRGFPRAIDGQLVLSIPEARWAALQGTGPVDLLVGGWFQWGVNRACGVGPPVALGNVCAPWIFGSVPNSGDGSYYLVIPYADAPRTWEPIVFRVHARDPRADECLPVVLLQCQHLLVFDSIAWRGGEPVTGVSTTEAAIRLARASPSLSAWFDQPDLALGFPDPAPGAACPLGSGVAIYRVWGDIRIRSMVMADDASALQAAIAGDPRDCGLSVDPAGPEPHWLTTSGVSVLLQDGDDTQLEQILRDDLDGSLEIPKRAGPATWGDPATYVVEMFEAVRGSGAGSAADILRPYGCCNDLDQDIVRRAAAGAQAADVVSRGAAGSKAARDAIPSAQHDRYRAATAQLFDVTHPDTSDAALRTETILAVQDVDGFWRVVIVEAAPFPPDPDFPDG